METGLRIVLLLVAFFILAGIVWDAITSRRKKSNFYKRSNAKINRKKFKQAKALFEKNDPFAEYSQNPFKEEDFDEDDPLKVESNEEAAFARMEQKTSSLDDFEDIILLKSKGASKAASQVVKEPIMKHLEQPNIETLEIEALETEALGIKKPEPKQIQDDVMILNLMARQPGVFGGRKMMEAFQEAHLYFGEMNIFHRHENMDGSGQIMFSLASAVEPGNFQISKMETFVTPGLTLFFVLEKPNQSIAAFELMLRTAKQLAMRLDGEIKDSQHKYLTLPTIEKYRERARNAGMVARIEFKNSLIMPT